MLAARELGNGGLADVGVLAVGILVLRGDQGKEVEVGVSDLRASGVGATVSPAGVELVEEAVQACDSALSLLLSGLIPHERHTFGLLKDVIASSVEPLGFVQRLGRGGGVAVIPSEEFQDGNALVLPLAVVADPDGKLRVTVGASCLNRLPLLEGESRVLESDALRVEHVADGLGAALNSEVDKLGHSVENLARYF